MADFFQKMFLWLLLGLSLLLLSGCLMSSLWTGATLFYGRHSVYKQVDDVQLVSEVNQALYHHRGLKGRNCYIDVAVLNGDILVAGHVPTKAVRQKVKARLAQVKTYRRMFNQVAVSTRAPNALLDSWITMKIRAQILANANINPKQFKVVTADQVVYLMGDVFPKQARVVIKLARRTSGVRKVVKIMRYYSLKDRMGFEKRQA